MTCYFAENPKMPQNDIKNTLNDMVALCYGVSCKQVKTKHALVKTCCRLCCADSFSYALVS